MTPSPSFPMGAQVEVIGTEGEWVKVLLPEREGYVHSDYLTITDTGQLLPLPGRDRTSPPCWSCSPPALSGGGGAALTPDGNLSLIDDLGGTSSGKQFITVETKGGNVFYLIIDRDDEGAQTVHFLNQVDEADLLALMEDGEAQETPAVCTCTEKCQAGAVNTSCEVCAVNMAECAGAEPEPEPEPEPEAEKSGGMAPWRWSWRWWCWAAAEPSPISSLSVPSRRPRSVQTRTTMILRMRRSISTRTNRNRRKKWRIRNEAGDL